MSFVKIFPFRKEVKKCLLWCLFDHIRSLVVTLTFDPLTSKSNQFIFSPTALKL